MIFFLINLSQFDTPARAEHKSKLKQILKKKEIFSETSKIVPK